MLEGPLFAFMLDLVLLHSVYDTPWAAVLCALRGWTAWLLRMGDGVTVLVDG